MVVNIRFCSTKKLTCMIWITGIWKISYITYIMFISMMKRNVVSRKNANTNYIHHLNHKKPASNEFDFVLLQWNKNFFDTSLKKKVLFMIWIFRKFLAVPSSSILRNKIIMLSSVEMYIPMLHWRVDIYNENSREKKMRLYKSTL